MADTTITETDILVIGAGIVGLSIAMEMLHQGKTVRIIDKDFQGPVRTHIGELALFGGDPVLFNLTKLSRDAWAEAEKRYDLSLGLMERGCLELATTPGRKVLTQTEAADDPATTESLLSVEAIANHAGMKLAPEVIAAKWEAKAPVLSTTTALETLREKVTQKGAIIWGSDEVIEFLSEEDEASTTLKGVRIRSGEVALAREVFVAAGALTSMLLGALHLTLPIRPARQHLITFKVPEDEGEENEISYTMLTHRLRRGHVVYKRLREGPIMVAYDGLMDPTQATYSQIPDDTVVDLIHTYTSANLLPAFRDATVEDSVAITAAVTPDFRPVIGRWRGVQGLWLATGFAGRSYTYAMVVAQTLGKILAGEMPALNLAPFAPERFELDRWPRFQRPPSLAWSEQATFTERAKFAQNVNTTGSGPAEFMDNVAMVDKHKVMQMGGSNKVREKGAKKVQMAGSRKK